MEPSAEVRSLRSAAKPPEFQARARAMTAGSLPARLACPGSGIAPAAWLPQTQLHSRRLCRKSLDLAGAEADGAVAIEGSPPAQAEMGGADVGVRRHPCCPPPFVVASAARPTGVAVRRRSVGGLAAYMG